MMATSTFTNTAIHTEAVVEQHLVERLVTGLGYEERTPADFDRALALDKGILLRFLKKRRSRRSGESSRSSTPDRPKWSSSNALGSIWHSSAHFT